MIWEIRFTGLLILGYAQLSTSPTYGILGDFFEFHLPDIKMSGYKIDHAYGIHRLNIVAEFQQSGTATDFRFHTLYFILVT